MEATQAPTRREIYPYHNGREQRFADPMKAYRLLVLHLEGDPKRFLDLAKSDCFEQASPAMERILEATAKAFGLHTFDEATGGGLTEDAVFAVFFGFLGWMQKKSPNTGSSPTSPPPTAPPSPYPTTTSTPASACG